MEYKKKKVTISISEGVLMDIDKEARIKGLSRSAYITKLFNDEHERHLRYLQDSMNKDYYGDLPLDTPRLKSLFDE